jgi:hypothetical protein
VKFDATTDRPHPSIGRPIAMSKAQLTAPPARSHPLSTLVLTTLAGGFFLLLGAGLYFEAVLPSDRATLLVVPSSELVVTPELAPTSPAHEELFGELIRGGDVYASPKQPVMETSEVKGQQAPSTLAKAGAALTLRFTTRSAVSPPPPPPHPSSSPPVRRSPPRPWLAEMARAARPLNRSAAFAADAPGRWAYPVQDVRPGTVLLARGKMSGKSYFDNAAILLLKVRWLTAVSWSRARVQM